MRKSFVYRIYPTNKQIVDIASFLNIGRNLYNSALEQRKCAWKMKRKSLNYYDQTKEVRELRQDIPELMRLNYQVCTNTLRVVDSAFKAFFRRVNRGEKAGYPRFKGYKRFNSITFPHYGNGVKIRENKLYVQNVGLIRIKLHRELEGKIKTVTIKRQCDKWYAIFSCVTDAKPLPYSAKEVGIDVGLESFAVTSDGEVIDNPRYLELSQRKLRVSQRSVARKKKGSNNRHKAVKLLAKQHLKISNQRKDFQHKVSRQIINEYGHIAVEDLKIKNMVKNHHLARGISDVGWGQFLNILSYKAEEAGRKFVKVNPKNTSQLCSNCLEKVPKTLSERTHNCPYCGISLHRDLNAAFNILRLGRSLWELTCRNTECVSQES